MSKTTENIKKLRIFVQDNIRGTLLGDGIVSFFKSLGINDLFTRILYVQDRKEPTKGMQNAEKYFTEHAEDLNKVASLFADDYSREIYFAAINYRKTHNPKDAPKYSKHDQYFVKDIVPLSDNEVFIDCGAFDGDTVNDFLKASELPPFRPGFIKHPLLCSLTQKVAKALLLQPPLSTLYPSLSGLLTMYRNVKMPLLSKWMWKVLN